MPPDVVAQSLRREVSRIRQLDCPTITLAPDGKSLTELVECRLPNYSALALIDEHNFALPFWWKWHCEGILPLGCALFHADAHGDDHIKVYHDDPLLRRKPPLFEEVLEFTIIRKRYDIESFIFPAVQCGLVDPTLWFEMGASGVIYNVHFNVADGHKEVWKEAVTPQEYRRRIRGKTLIGDSDTDIFDPGNTWAAANSGRIIATPDLILEYTEGAKANTVAISPACVARIGAEASRAYAEDLGRKIYLRNGA